MTIRPRIYLAGPIFEQTDEEARDWREYVKARYDGPTLDPMRRDYRGREASPAVTEAIVAGDKLDIKRSDVLIANCPRPSYGTAIEIFYAHSIGVPVVAVMPAGPVSPWVVHHATAIVHNLDEGIDLINDKGFWIGAAGGNHVLH